IRASVDALCRDDTSEISRDPHTKRLETRREWLAMPSKHTTNHSRVHIYLYTCPKVSYVPAILDTRICSYAISDFRVIIFFIFFFFKPAISLPVPAEALIFSLNVSNFAGGVHGHQAIISFLPQVTTVDHGALPWSTLNNAIFAANSAASVSRPCACMRQTGARRALERTTWSPRRAAAGFSLAWVCSRISA
ncbi:hypothetical protein GBAR_LOCUS29682, partial [Geodia barretti]